MNDYVVLVAGVVCAGVGGELFVRGAVGLAHLARVSPGIIGATVAAFATSSPELSVSIGSAVAGTPEIALGDALGSNVVNVALILALALVISGIHCPRHSLRRDFPVALAAPVFTAVLLLDGELSRFDGVLMLGVFLSWLLVTIVEARKQRSAAENVLGESRASRVLASCAVGLGLLVAAGNLVVAGGRGIAISLGIDEFIVGATLVAIGTSAPELATAVIAKLRGHDEVGLGTIIGSNIFNGVFVVAIAAIIHPITVAWEEVAIVLACGVAALALSYPWGADFIGRRRGMALLLLYTVYLAALYTQRSG